VRTLLEVFDRRGLDARIADRLRRVRAGGGGNRRLLMTRRFPAFALALLWFCIDRGTKMLVEARMNREDVLTVIPNFFNLVYTANRGMAFSLLSEGESEWRSFFLIGLTLLVLALVSSILWQTSPRGLAANPLSRVGLARVLGGALGNLYDRLASGAVTDFLDFYIASYHWPAFNVADMGLSIGAGLVVLDFWRSRRREAA
jgi:signal peptidase II